MSTVKLSFIMPGTGGINTDVPPWGIEPNQVVRLVNGITVDSVVQQRRGWKYRTDAYVYNADYYKEMDSFTERYYPITRRIGSVATQGTDLWTLSTEATPVWRVVPSPANSYSSGASLNQPLGGVGVASVDISDKRTPRYLPRTYYNGETLFCSTDGFYPILRYCGAVQNTSTALVMAASGTVFTSGKSTASLAVSAGQFESGHYWNPITNYSSQASWPLMDATPTGYSLDGFQANANTSQPSAMHTFMFGVPWAAQEVFSEGTVSIGGSGVLTFSNGGYDSDLLLHQGNAPYPWMHDCLHVETSAGLEWRSYPLVTSTVVGSSASTGSNMNYSITRRLAFRDIASHGGVLFGAGSLVHPSRVWYTEANWNLSMPPEVGAPFWNYGTDPFIQRRAGLMRYVDVPGEGTDEIIAIVSTDSPLLVLKNNAVYGIYGAFPNYTQNMLASGAGCIDVRAAISVDGYGTFWAGANGIFSYKKGKITDLTDERVSQEWRRRIKAYRTDKNTDNCVALGISAGHLIVSCSVGDSGAKDEWVWVYNLNSGAWSELTNMNSRYFQTVYTNAGIEGTLAALTGNIGSYEGRRPVNIQPALLQTGDVDDDNDVVPYLEIETGSTVDGDRSPSRESRLTEVRIDGLVDDEGTPSTELDVAVSSSSAVDESGTTTQDVGTMLASNDGVTHQKRFRAGLSGRDNRVVLSVSKIAAANKTIQIHEIGVSIRSRRPER